MNPVLLALLALLLLPLLFLMGRKAYGKARETGPKGGDGEGDAKGIDIGPG